ncbi:MAG: alpha-galactosidase [Bacteroidaceae bacterium]|nr:alpha-galactosidase [Bacteroidaceae bacterium]
MKTRFFLSCVALCLGVAALGQTTKDGPTMGWSSWNTYGINISDKLIKVQADNMVKKGLLDVGYRYINIDDGYFGKRDPETGALLTHPTRFPNGLKDVVDYIHSKGLRAGIYSDVGYNTCGSQGSGDPWGIGSGMYDHQDQDMKWWFGELGFDFIKVDFCGGMQLIDKDKTLTDRILYGLSLDAFEKIARETGRDSLRFNICRWSYPGTWAYGRAGSWRTTGDIYCAWESVRNIIKTNLPLSAFCRKGHYNDMDMLEVGRGMSTEEDRTHFSMWCLMNSPLLIGCDLASINKNALKLLTNAELIAINQDTLYKQAYVVDEQDGIYLLVRDVISAYDTMRVAAVYNSTDSQVEYTMEFDKLELGGKVKIRSITYGMDLTQDYEGSYKQKIPAHANRVFRLDAQERIERTNYEAETAFLSQFHESGLNSASFSSADGCSGKYKVGWLGGRPENDMQWQNVWSREGGKYKMTIYYCTGQQRKFSVDVNGRFVKTFTVNNGSWDTSSPVDCEIELEPGENVVRLYNETGWAPDMDRMTLELIEAPTAVKAVVGEETAKASTKTAYDIQGRPIADPDALPRGTIYIENQKKKVKPSVPGEPVI